MTLRPEPPDSDTRWVFGLSIDDQLTCAFAQVRTEHGARGWSGHTSAYPGAVEIAKLADLPNGRGSRTSLVDLIEAELGGLRDHPRIGEVAAVGVSSIGLVDHRQARLVDIRRKPWAWEAPNEYVLDIGGAVRRALGKEIPVAANNDATAKAMAHHCFADVKLEETLAHVMCGYGVNIGVADGIGALSCSNLHPEMGHAYPRLHQRDAARGKAGLRPLSGCPIHIDCYEGVASGARIMKEWGAPISELSGDARDEAMEIMACYLAQLCWNVTVSVAPSRILLSGPAIWPGLLKPVQAEFMRLNGKGPGALAYLSARAYRGLDDGARTFIQMAEPFRDMRRHGIEDPSGAMGALELARKALIYAQPARAL